MTKAHTFHIPVMGIGYTIDTPIKVSQYGIDSVISLVDDILLEKFRKFYCEKFDQPYHEISNKIEDFRAKRITSYLNLICQLAEKKFEEFKNATIEKKAEIKEYFSMLPDSSHLKQEFKELTSKFSFNEIGHWLKENLQMGSIDVNIMTKIDKDNYSNGEKLPVEFNDGHAAIRGFANSKLRSSVILSAGLNPRIYGYMENFEDFFPNENGDIKKKIVLKVSDYRSAIIQGKFLAKKGLWVSEFRIESGLNCGGHAFATDGYLLGPVLQEFKDKKSELIQTLHEIMLPALKSKNKTIPKKVLPIKIVAQGGVGTSEEHQFLLDHYEVDSVGWGSPFLLVPEATTVDQSTISLLKDAEEKDLYLSNISPLGIPFNSLKGNTKDVEKNAAIEKGKPGSACPKEYAALNTEFSSRSICVASRQYQKKKIEELDLKDLSLSNYQSQYDKIVEKSCICVGLGTSAMIANEIDTKTEGRGVSVCPGPNIAYFSKIMSLKEIVDHIYGRSNVISRQDRPNMFIKELTIYLDYLKGKIEEAKSSLNQKQEKQLNLFISNLKEGINYYENLFQKAKDFFNETKANIFKELEASKIYLQQLKKDIETISSLHILKKTVEEKVEI